MTDLPNLADDDLDEQMQIIAAKDKEILLQLSQFTADLNHHEKMALCVHAVVTIDKSHTQLCSVTPAHGTHPPVLKAAVSMLRHLSPQALCELAVDILSDDWDLGAELDAPSTLIE